MRSPTRPLPGVLGLCEATPRLILGTLAGVLVDRYDRLRLLILVHFCSAIPAFVMVVFSFMGILEFWNILVLVLVRAVVRSISPSASQSLIRELVPDKELMGAISLYTIGFNLARVTGPFLGGVLILWIGVGGCFLLYGLSLVISGLGFLFIRIPKRKVRRGEGKLLREIREGLHYVWQAPLILSCVTAAYVISIFVGTYQWFLQVFAKEVLGVGPEGLGIMMAAPGTGAILSLIFLGSVGEEWRRETLLWVTAMLTPVFLVVFCLSRSFSLSVVVLALGSSWRGQYNVSHRQSGDYSNEGSCQSLGQGDERFITHGSSSDALNWFSGHRHFGSPIWWRARARITSIVCLTLTSALFSSQARLLGRA